MPGSRAWSRRISIAWYDSSPGPARAFTWPDAALQVERDLGSPDAGVRLAAVHKLPAVGASGGAPLLLRALSAPDVEVRIAAAHAAVSTHAKDASKAVPEWLADRDPRLRQEACAVLGQLPEPGDVAQLARTTQHLDYYAHLGLKDGAFFDRETFGTDKLVVVLDKKSIAQAIALARSDWAGVMAAVVDMAAREDELVERARLDMTSPL